MPYSVMIVDDSAVMRGFIRRVLTLSGFEVGECLEASNGEEALAGLEGKSCSGDWRPTRGCDRCQRW
jgi:two-component system chemotaxis response regulator CheY